MARALSIRVIVEPSAFALVYRLSEALEAAEMEGTRALLIERLSDGQGIETVVGKMSVRASLRPFAELMLFEIIDVAERPGLPTAVRECLARQVMVDAGYA